MSKFPGKIMGITLGVVILVLLTAVVLGAGRDKSLPHAVKITVFTNEGKKVELHTRAATVERALAKARIKTAGFNIYPGNKVRPSDGLTVVLLGENESIVEETAPIPIPVISRHSSHIMLGDSTVMQEGRAGEKGIMSKVKRLPDGRVIKTALKEVVLREPEAKILVTGTGNTVETSRGTMRFSRRMTMEATAYTPWDEGCIGITKMGIPAEHGIAAVDPDVIPLGTSLYVPGYGIALAADIGGAIEGHRIDLCMESTEDAFAFGRRDVIVYVLE